MKGLFFAAAVISAALGATAMSNSTVAPGDRYVQTSSGVYQKITATYNPSTYCNLAANPCSFVIPQGDTNEYPEQISRQEAVDAGFTPANSGLYLGPL